uniref:YadA C-terminal domain-containing protein n=1 Tax=Leclercia sp. Marseille-Q4284 TaxID=2866582 RepID=UPI001CE3CB14
PQSTPVAQLTPVVQQQTPQAVPPRPQSTPVAQLTPVAPQQIPQAVPPRPQSTPVVQLTPVAHPQLTPLPNLVLVHNAQEESYAEAIKPDSYDAGRGWQQTDTDQSRAAHRSALEQDKQKLADEKVMADYHESLIQQSNASNEQIANVNHLPYDASAGEFDSVLASEKQRQAAEDFAQVQEGEAKAESIQSGEKIQHMLTAAHDAPLESRIAQIQAQSRADEQTEAGHFKTLQTAVDQKVDTGTFQQRAADVDQRIAERKAAQQKTDAVVSRHSAELADHETRIENLEANTSANFGKLKSQVEENRKRASAGIAGVAAMANIPQVIQGQTFAVGAGVGNTDGESALAIGASARATENVVVKASVSDDTQQNFVVGAGVSYGW